MLCDSRSSRCDMDAKGSALGCGLVEAAFPLQPEKPGLLGREIGGEGTRRMCVSNRDIALVPERMVGQVVLFQVAMNVAVAPVDDGQNLVASVLHADDRKLLAGARLRMAKSGQPGTRVQLLQGSFHRLDLRDPI